MFWVLKHSVFSFIISHTEISTSFCKGFLLLAKFSYSFQAGHTETINTYDRSTFLFSVLIFLCTLFWLLDLEASDI